ncbi:PREDICTED: probable transcription factor At1g61730 [Camelina sativa]|uniref:Probable transcription factor At1g61730 n=1 Tax=Camelina sativa TaxID=90675 RepID=A0ABM0TRK3_CAMSA|nr:PREDICTED: probable transcription factor At1g61730 [Camelina sativa]
MTKKLNPLEDPPSASSSDDDDIETSEAGDPSDDSSSSEDDESSKTPIKSLASVAAAAAAAASSKSTVVAESDSGSETETDSDSESTNPPNSGSGKTISVNLKKKEDPTSSTALALPAAKSGGTKRPASEAAAAVTASANKRVKKGGGEEESVKKPGGFHRLWTEEDEIAVLQGMIDFKADTGKSPYEDSNGYYDFIKKDISFEVSKNQFMDKLRSLRKKYMGKEVKNGVEPSFAKPHDQKAYELAKTIWGPDGIAATESNVKSNGVSKRSKAKKKLDSVKQELVYAGDDDGDDDDDDDMDVVVHGRKSDLFVSSSLVRMIAGCGVDEYYVKRQWSLLPVETKKVVEEKLKLLQAKELEFVVEKSEFLHEVSSMIVEASKNKKSH